MIKWEYNIVTRTRKSMQFPLPSILKGLFYDLATPPNLSSWWNFGSCLGLLLGLQIITGLFLAMHYSCDISLAFRSVSHIMRDVRSGWLLRYLHANGATFIFFCLYAHVGRGLYFGSYNLFSTWSLGVCLLLLSMGTAFLGYVLPWGQISFWGATVITNLFSVFPYFGPSLVSWLWGGFSIDNATLTRFFALHFLLPFLLSGARGLHIFYLHTTGSSNPLGISSASDKVCFHCYYSFKDIFGFVTMISLLLVVVLFFPLFFFEVENFRVANPLITPAHIVPEWYFLFAYAILRSVSSPLGGVVSLFSSILILLLFKFTNVISMKGLMFYGPVKILFWVHVVNFLMLTALGGSPLVLPFTTLSIASSILYFLYFLVLPLACMVWERVVDITISL